MYGTVREGDRLHPRDRTQKRETMWFKRFCISKVVPLYIAVTHLLQQGFAQTVRALGTVPECGGTITLYCDISTALNLSSTRQWHKNGVPFSISNTLKYEEVLDVTAMYFAVKIKSFTNNTDAGAYKCQYNFPISPPVEVYCKAPTTTECEDKKGYTIVIIIYGICAGITVIMWVICCWLQYKKEERCQKWCCIIVHGFFAVIAWILWGISYWQCLECCQCQKVRCIVLIVFGFCAAVSGIISEILCILQYKVIIHWCIPPCCGFCVCIDCEEKEKEPDFIKYAKQELQWMDQKIVEIQENVSSGTDAAAKLNKAEQGRLDTCEKRCKEEEEKLRKDSTNSYGEMIRDYIRKLRVKMHELKKLQPEGNTLVKKKTKEGDIEMKEPSRVISELPPSKLLETEGKWRPLPQIAPSK